jgi:hypothetical protein
VFEETAMRDPVVRAGVCVVVLSVSGATGLADECGPSAKLLADDGAPSDRFGYSVAMSQGVVVIGARHTDDTIEDSGSAYLFDALTGAQLAKLLPDDAEPMDQFGYSVAIDGAIALVGAAHDDDNGNLSGSAYLFDVSDPAHPVQLAKLLPDDGQTTDYFGRSVGLAGGWAVIGAWGDADLGNDSGAAYVFDVSHPARPAQVAKLLPDDGEAFDHFGYSVAIDGQTAIVGAIFDDDNGSLSGSAYLFDVRTGEQIAKLVPDDGGEDDEFGNAVAIDGAVAIVGAHYDGDNGTASGSAYLFDATTGKQLAKLLPDDGASIDKFGTSVAISAERAVVGARHDDDNITDSGSAYLFDATTGKQLAKLLPDDGEAFEEFGISACVEGNVAVLGAWLDDDNGDKSGSAYVFDLACPCPADVNADGNLNILDFVAFQLLWQHADPAADCDANAAFNILDFVCFQQLFQAGCP